MKNLLHCRWRKWIFLETAARSRLYLYDGYMVPTTRNGTGSGSLMSGHADRQRAFLYPPQPESNIAILPPGSDGPIWDIGCYCLLSGMMLFDGTPELVAVHKEQEEHLDVERTATAIVDFGRGQTLHFTASSGSSLQQSVTLVGTDGWAKLDVPFNASRVTTARWAHRDETPNTMLGTGIEVTFEPCDQYQLMVEDFARAVTEERKADLSESRHLTRILGAMVAA